MDQRIAPYRDQSAVATLLSRRASSSSGSFCALRAPGASLHGLLAPGLRLSVFVGALGFGLQTALVQGQSLLPLELEALHGRVVVAALAAVVMPPEELDAPPEPLHHRAVPRHHIIRHRDQPLPRHFISPKTSISLISAASFWSAGVWANGTPPPLALSPFSFPFFPPFLFTKHTQLPPF